jgi:hypothetical protein
MKNEFIQFDQFEVLTSAKNKFLYDFAHSALNENTTGSSSLWMIKNKITRSTNMTTASGDIGVRPIVFGNPVQSPLNVYGPIYTAPTAQFGLSSGATLTSTYPLTSDNGQEQVPLMEENTLVYLGTTSETNLPTSYRSGYIELSFKTTKQNCVLGYGSAVIRTSQATVNNLQLTGLRKNISDPKIGNISGSQYTSDEPFADINELLVSIKNGKLTVSYNDIYGINEKSFEVISNTTVADGNWHHVVVNITRPGLVSDQSKTKKGRSIELWIDGDLNKVDNNSINNDQVFFPEILWLGANPVTLFNSQMSDLFYSGFDSQDANTLARNEFTANVWNGVWTPEAEAEAFAGAIRTFAHGLNMPLSKFEIQERFKFWKYDELPYRDSMIASATMQEPSVSVNKKKALKLFWTDIPNKNGIELDDNFIVDSYSITHKNKNSATETFNLDLAKKKAITVLPNVRIAIEDNLLLWAPGNISPQNFNPGTLNSNRLGPNQGNPNEISEYSGFAGSFTNLTFSGVELNSGDRVLLTNQINKSENGIWIFNGKTSPLTRPSDADSPTKVNNSNVYVTEGTYSETYWILESNIGSFKDAQKWVKLNQKPGETIYSQPFLTSRWEDVSGNARLIDITNDINVSGYDLIVFMNYPETLSEIKDQFPDEDITKLYKDFVQSVKEAVVAGSSVYVSSPMLALDLGIVNKFESIPQLAETSDAQSATINPFQPGETSDKYFDTHRNNQYQLATPVAGLTNRQTYILTDFINYIPNNSYDYEQYHAKYSYRQNGLLEGNAWLIPGLALTKFTENENLPGSRDNYRGTKDILGVNMNTNGIYGTVVTKLANTYYAGSTVTNNPYDDYATTIAVLPGQTLGGQTISGKIFMNVIEDGYTFSRADYNKAYVQVLPVSDTNETNNTRLWQYSTNRLDRESDRQNIKVLTEHGQTVPTQGGGGGFLQSASNASNGTIRSKSDANNIDYQSDYYPQPTEELYPTQEIPVLSMTYLGLLWLAE